MSQQEYLHYRKAYARSTDPVTSHEAAEAVSPSLPTLDDQIIAYLKTRPDGATSLEISDAIGRTRVSVSPCLRPLERLGMVIDTGEKRKSDATGFKGLIWKAAA